MKRSDQRGVEIVKLDAGIGYLGQWLPPVMLKFYECKWEADNPVRKESVRRADIHHMSARR